VREVKMEGCGLAGAVTEVNINPTPYTLHPTP